jgi:hypothetical protein
MRALHSFVVRAVCFFRVWHGVPLMGRGRDFFSAWMRVDGCDPSAIEGKDYAKHYQQ